MSFRFLECAIDLNAVKEFVYHENEIILPYILCNEYIDLGNFGEEIMDDSNNGEHQVRCAENRDQPDYVEHDQGRGAQPGPEQGVKLGV